MPKYNAEITYGTFLSFPEIVKCVKWLTKHIGCWISVEYKLLGASKCKKTKQQLGYYWGLLQPEAHKHHIAEGLTITAVSQKIKINGKPMSVEIIPTLEDSHEILKAYCARVGDDGEYITMADMDKFQAKKFVDNVIYHLTFNYGMNGDELKARQPKLELNETTL